MRKKMKTGLKTGRNWINGHDRCIHRIRSGFTSARSCRARHLTGTDRAECAVRKTRRRNSEKERRRYTHVTRARRSPPSATSAKEIEAASGMAVKMCNEARRTSTVALAYAANTAPRRLAQQRAPFPPLIEYARRVGVR